MAGLNLLMEWMNWTKEQVVDAYSLRLDVQYALNLGPVAHDLSVRTLEWYQEYFEQGDLAQQVLHKRLPQAIIWRLPVRFRLIQRRSRIAFSTALMDRDSPSARADRPYGL